jgi:polyferredoxin
MEPSLQTAPPAAARPVAEPPRRRYGPWRAAALILVNAAMVAHFVHWKLAGRTVAPLEFSELMATVGQGVITAGAIFMGVAVLATLVFGRFFCSWACHILALQDLCRWLLAKLGLRPKPVRSRALLFVPGLTALYLFAWPVAARLLHGEPQPGLRLPGDGSLAAFVVEDYWHSMPGPWVAAITFLVCGFLTVYVLGSRSFCSYVCPYGAIFHFADRFAPGRIRVAEGCDACGECTAACGNYVRVAEEVRAHGRVVNPACMKAMDCVSACPKDVLHFGFAKPALFTSWTSGGRFGLPYSFTLAEDVLVGALCLAAALALYGLYGRVGLLLALSAGGMFGYLAVLALRLFRRREVKLGHLRLRATEGLRPAGYAYMACFALVAALLAHSGFVRWHEARGVGPALALRYEPDAARRAAGAEEALVHLETARRWSLFPDEPVERARLSALLHLGRFEPAGECARDLVARHPDDTVLRLKLAECYERQGRPERAREEARLAQPYAAQAVEHDPQDARLRLVLADCYERQGELERAEAELRRVVELGAEVPAAIARQRLEGLAQQRGTRAERQP